MDYERRRPRSVFSRKLTRMCDRLDAGCCFSISRYNRWLRKKITSQVEICDLWVVGSYARGARECGDLDVLIRVKSDNAPPLAHEIAKEAFGRMSDVRIYEGTPQQNSSGVPFTEAVHLWGSGVNWRSAITSIKEDSAATRFTRPTDAIPLRAEQIFSEVDDLEALVDLKQKGVLAWQFIPYEPSPQSTELSEPEKRLVRLSQFWGKMTRKLLPFLLAYVRQCGMPLTRIEEESGTRQLNVSGMLINLGRPKLPYKQLDKLIYSRVALFPHKSLRGPNGIWELRRSKCHPLEVAAESLAAYVQVDESNVACSCQYVGKSGYPEGPGVDLFVTEERASRIVEQEDEAPPVAFRRISGSELLDVISCADVVDIHHGEREITTIPLRWNGAAALAEGGRVDLVDTEAALAAMREHLAICTTTHIER